MLQQIELLRDLNDLSSGSRAGLHKRWPLKDEAEFDLLCDYLQKVNYCIQDFNSTISEGFDQNRKDTVFLIALTDWIIKAVEQVSSCYSDEVLNSFSYSRQAALDSSRNYFKALRSFVLAHPLGTNRHKEYGLDGDLICIDIGSAGTATKMLKDGHYRLTYSGIVPISGQAPTDVILSVYRKTDGAAYFQHIGFDMRDVRDIAEVQIDYLYALDRYLAKQKQRDYLA